MSTRQTEPDHSGKSRQVFFSKPTCARSQDTISLEQLAADFAEDAVNFFSKESRDLDENFDFRLEPAKVTRVRDHIDDAVLASSDDAGSYATESTRIHWFEAIQDKGEASSAVFVARYEWLVGGQRNAFTVRFHHPAGSSTISDATRVTEKSHVSATGSAPRLGHTAASDD